MKNRIKRNIIVAIAKGFAHATIIPIGLMVLTNIVFSGNWGIVTAVVYLFSVTIIYLVAKNKDISKRVFFSTLRGIAILLLTLVVITMVYLVWS